MTRQEFINLMKLPASKVRLAKALENAGVLEHFSQLISANRAFNQGGFRQVLAECNLDLLMAELEDLRCTSGRRLQSALLGAKAALATLDNPQASPSYRASEEKELRRAEKEWKRWRWGAVQSLWEGVVVSPGAFYDRASELLAGASLPQAIPEHETATGKESALYLAAVVGYAISEEFNGTTLVHLLVGLLMIARTILKLPQTVSISLSLVGLLAALCIWKVVSNKISKRENLPVVRAALSQYLSQ